MDRAADRSRLYEDALDAVSDAPPGRAPAGRALASRGGLTSGSDREARPAASESVGDGGGVGSGRPRDDAGGGARPLPAAAREGAAPSNGSSGGVSTGDVPQAKAPSGDGAGAGASGPASELDAAGTTIEPPPVTPTAPSGCGGRKGEHRRSGRPPGRPPLDSTPGSGGRAGSCSGGGGEWRGTRGSSRGGALASALAPSHWPKAAAALWSWPPVSRFFSDIGADDLAALAPPTAGPGRAGHRRTRAPFSSGWAEGGVPDRAKAESPPPPRNGKRARVATPTESLPQAATPPDASPNVGDRAELVDVASDAGRPLPPRGRYFRLAWLEEDAQREAASLPWERSPVWPRRPRGPGGSTDPDLSSLKFDISARMDPVDASGIGSEEQPRQRQSQRPVGVDRQGDDEVRDETELDGVYCSQRHTSDPHEPMRHVFREGGRTAVVPTPASMPAASEGLPASPVPAPSSTPRKRISRERNALGSGGVLAGSSTLGTRASAAAKRRPSSTRSPPPTRTPSTTRASIPPSTQAPVTGEPPASTAPRKGLCREKNALGNGVLLVASRSGRRGGGGSPSSAAPTPRLALTPGSATPVSRSGSTPGSASPGSRGDRTPDTATPVPRVGLSRERKSLGDGILPSPDTGTLKRTRHGAARPGDSIAAPDHTEPAVLPCALSQPKPVLKAPPPVPLPLFGAFTSGTLPGTSASVLVELQGPNPSVSARASLAIPVSAGPPLPGASVQHRLPPPTLDDFELTLPSAVSVVPLDPPRPSPKCEPELEVDVGVCPTAGHLASGATTADAGTVAPGTASLDAAFGVLGNKACASDESDEVSMELRRLQAELGNLIRAHTPLRAAVQVRAHMDMAQARVVASRKREERVLLGKLREFRRAKQSVRAYSRSPGGGPASSGYGSARASPNASGIASPRPRRPRRVDVEDASPDAIASLVLPSSTTAGGAASRVPALPPLVLDMCVPASLPGRGTPRSTDGIDALDAAFGQQGAVQVRGELDDSTQPLGTQLLGWVDSALMALRGFTPAVPGTAPVYAAASPGGGPRPFGAASPGRGAPTGDEIGAYLLALSKAAQPRPPSESPPRADQQPQTPLIPAGGLGAVVNAGAIHSAAAAATAGAAGGDAGSANVIPDIDVRQLRPVRRLAGLDNPAAQALGGEARTDACAPEFVDAAEAWQRFRVLRLELERTRTLAALIQRRENIKHELNDVTFQRFEAALATAQEHIEFLEPMPVPPPLPPTPSSPGMRPFSLATPAPAGPSSGASLVGVGGRGGVTKLACRSSPGTGPRRGGSIPALAGGGLTANAEQHPLRRPVRVAAPAPLSRTASDLRRVLGHPPVASVSNGAHGAARGGLSAGAVPGSRAVPSSTASGSDTGAVASSARLQVVALEPSAPVAGHAAAGGPPPVRHGPSAWPLAAPAVAPASGHAPVVSCVGVSDELPSSGPCVAAAAARPVGSPSVAVAKAVAAWAAGHRASAAEGGQPPSPVSLPLRSFGMASPSSRVTAPAVRATSGMTSLEGHTTAGMAAAPAVAPAVVARSPHPPLPAALSVVTVANGAGRGAPAAPPRPAPLLPPSLPPAAAGVGAGVAKAGGAGVAAAPKPSPPLPSSGVAALPVAAGVPPAATGASAAAAERPSPPPLAPVARVTDAAAEVLFPPPTTSTSS